MTRHRPLARTLGTPTSVQGISFDAGTQLYFGLSDELVMCMLPQDQVIAGVPCAKGAVHFHPGGQLAQATLNADHTANGVKFAGGSVLAWDEDGTLAADVVGQHRIGGVTLPCGAWANVTRDGRLLTWARRLDAEETVADTPCPAGSVVTYYANGNPARLTVASQHVVRDGLAALDGSDLTFHANGALEAITLGATARCAGISFAAGTTLVFRDDETLHTAQLVAPTEIDGREFDEGTTLHFDASQALIDHTAVTWRVCARARS